MSSDRALTPAEAAILRWTLDGDSIGLYAVGWPEDSTWSARERDLASAREAAVGLVRDGLLEVVRAEWRDGGLEEGPLARSRWERVLADPENWGTGDLAADSGRSPHYRLAGTNEGDALYLAFARRSGRAGFGRIERIVRALRGPR